jgi:hypothetical protein
MAGQAVLKGIKDSWSFMDFARKMGQPKRAQLTNNETGENFAALMFPTKQGDRDFTMVAFSSKLGELSAQEIAARKDELQVVQLEESDNLYLCAKGSGAWEDIALF